jgi:sugar phosphate isomerase/epimerase
VKYGLATPCGRFNVFDFIKMAKNTEFSPKSSDVPDIGWCGTPDKAGDMLAAGLDYVELQLVPMRLEEDVEFEYAKKAVSELPLPSPVMSYLFPHDLRLVGPDVHESRARSYIDRVIELMNVAGAKYLVYGSGWTRNIPEGFDSARAEDQFLHALNWCGKALAGIDATLIIEPLNKKESNQCNRVVDGINFAKQTGLKNVKGLADFYHVDEESEPLSVVGEMGKELAHIHLADTGRMNPGTGIYDYRTFFGGLKKSGYSGRLSAECAIKGDPVTGMRMSADFLRKTWLSI